MFFHTVKLFTTQIVKCLNNCLLFKGSVNARQAKQVSLQCCGEVSRDGLMQLAAMFMVNVRLHQEQQISKSA